MKNSTNIKTEIYTVASPSEMEKLGSRLAVTLEGGDVVLLSGDLGAGKTVFCKGLAKGLNITAPVTSPTFTIMNEYCGGTIKLCHFDAYRLEDEDEAFGAGLTDFIGNPEVVCAVEWWEKIKGLFRGLRVVHVDVKKTGDSIREVTVTR